MHASDWMTTSWRLTLNLLSTRSFFARSPEKKWVHENVIFRSVYIGQLRLCMSLLCDNNIRMRVLNYYAQKQWIIQLNVITWRINVYIVIGVLNKLKHHAMITNVNNHVNIYSEMCVFNSILSMWFITKRVIKKVFWKPSF
jgi:hypothetical protein